MASWFFEPTPEQVEKALAPIRTLDPAKDFSTKELRKNAGRRAWTALYGLRAVQEYLVFLVIVVGVTVAVAQIAGLSFKEVASCEREAYVALAVGAIGMFALLELFVRKNHQPRHFFVYDFDTTGGENRKAHLEKKAPYYRQIGWKLRDCDEVAAVYEI